MAVEALSPAFAGVAASQVLDVPKPKTQTLAQHGRIAWNKALSYAQDFTRGDSDSDLAATLILRVARDFEVVRFRNGREVPLRHPAFGEQPVYTDERGKGISFERVMGQALKESEFSNLSLYPVAGELVAKSPSGKWQAVVSEVIPKPWYDALVMVGKTAMGGKHLDRFSYHAKLHLIGEGDPLSDDMASRLMTQRHRLKSDEMRLFKGDPDGWQHLKNP